MLEDVPLIPDNVSLFEDLLPSTADKMTLNFLQSKLHVFCVNIYTSLQKISVMSFLNILII